MLRTSDYRLINQAIISLLPILLLALIAFTLSNWDAVPQILGLESAPLDNLLINP